VTQPLTPADAGALHARLRAEGKTIDALPLVAAAVTAARLERHEDALALARAAVVAEPQNARAWALIGQASEARGALEEARTAYEHACSLDGHDFGAALAAARLQQRTGQHGRARALCGFILARTSSPDVRQQTSELLGTLGDAA